MLLLCQTIAVNIGIRRYRHQPTKLNYTSPYRGKLEEETDRSNQNLLSIINIIESPDPSEFLDHNINGVATVLSNNGSESSEKQEDTPDHVIHINRVNFTN